MKVEKGQIVIDIETIARDETIMRAIAQYALKIEKESSIYQSRAWRAEWTVQRFKEQLLSLAGDDQRQREDIQRICNVKAHAQEVDK